MVKELKKSNKSLEENNNDKLNNNNNNIFTTSNLLQDQVMTTTSNTSTSNRKSNANVNGGGLGGVGVGAGIGIDTTIAPAHYYDTTILPSSLLSNLPLSEQERQQQEEEEEDNFRVGVEIGESDFNYFNNNNNSRNNSNNLHHHLSSDSSSIGDNHHERFEERTNAFASGSGTKRISISEQQRLLEEGEDDDESDSELDDTALLKALQKMDQDADIAFNANTRYQSEVLAVMKKLARATVRTEELQLLVQDMHDELEKGSEMILVAPGTVQVSLPWFKFFHGQELPSNPEGQARDLYLASIRHIPWTQVERNLLRSEIIAHNSREVARIADINGQDMDEALARHPTTFYTAATANLDWEKIALPLIRRSAMDCKIQWLQVDHPQVNKGKWSSVELERMYEIAIKKGERDWQGIANELGTGRNPAECLRRYRQRPGQRREWTPKEDDLLREGVKMYGLNWQSIAHHVGRHSNQCINRWNKTLRPTIKRGKWTPEEDATLLAAVSACGMSWKHVEARVRGRTDAQCRERWVNKVDPRLCNPKIWLNEDDERLKRMRSDGKSWSEIANTFEGQRTDNHCKRRHRVLSKKKRMPPNAAERKAIQDKRLLDEADGNNGEDGSGESGEEGEDINMNDNQDNNGIPSVLRRKRTLNEAELETLLPLLPEEGMSNLNPAASQTGSTSKQGKKKKVKLNEISAAEILVGSSKIKEGSQISKELAEEEDMKKFKVKKTYKPRVKKAIKPFGEGMAVEDQPRRSSRARIEKTYQEFTHIDDLPEGVEGLRTGAEEENVVVK